MKSINLSKEDKIMKKWTKGRINTSSRSPIN